MNQTTPSQKSCINNISDNRKSQETYKNRGPASHFSVNGVPYFFCDRRFYAQYTLVHKIETACERKANIRSFIFPFFPHSWEKTSQAGDLAV